MLVKISYYAVVLVLLLTAGPVSLWATPTVLPQPQAARFCRLMVCDNEGRVVPLRAYIRQQSTPSGEEGLTVEQLFTSYVIDYEGWRTLRIFPHHLPSKPSGEGPLRWYAPDDILPNDMSEEHRKYIREVFPRLLTEIEAGNWATVDAYIDRMIQYQCRFGSATNTSANLNVLVPAIIGILLVFPFIFLIFQKIISTFR